MSGSVRRTSAFVGGAVFLFVVGMFVLVGLAGDSDADPGIVGQTAPRIVGTSLEGEFFDSDDIDGFLVVNFFALWCPGCIAEHPELVRAQTWGEENNVELVAAVFDSVDIGRIRQFFIDNGGDWPVLDDPAVATNFAVGRIPETFVVGPNNMVLERFQGEVTLADIQAVVEAYDG